MTENKIRHITDLIEKRELVEIQEAFSRTFGIASQITDVNGNPITEPTNFCRLCKFIRDTEKGAESCRKSGKILAEKAEREGSVVYQNCLSCGLVDAAAPIVVEGEHLANWVVGQINFNAIDEESIRKIARAIGADEKKMTHEAMGMRSFDQEQFKNIISLLEVISSKISSLALQNLRLMSEMVERQRTEEKLVEERRRLMQADKLAAIGTMVSSIAHEIKNPVNAILLNNGFLKEIAENLAEKLDAETKDEMMEVVDIIGEAADKIGEIVEELRSFSRASSEKISTKVSVNNVVLSALKLIGPMIRKSTANLNVDLDEEIPPVTGNFQSLEHLVINLVQNGCQALTSKDDGVEIRTRRHGEKGVCIEVEDRGKGIKQEDLKQIFEPFFTTKRDSGGTGLGMAIVRKITVNHGGKIEISSTVGEGTVVRIIFPGTVQSVNRNTF